MTNPIVQVAALKGDWEDNPNLSGAQVEYLKSLSDDVLDNALDTAFEYDDDRYLAIFDEIRIDATNLLLRQGNMEVSYEFPE